MEKNVHPRQLQKTTYAMRLALSGLILILGLAMAGKADAAKKYITDEFEVTMRSGTSTSNSIVKILKSGETVEVLEEDLASQYSLVEADDGKKGYVLSRFLDNIPSARERLARLQEKNEQQKQTVATLTDEIKQLKSELDKEQTDNQSLKNTLLASENELDRVKTAAEDTLRILEDNKRINAIVEILREEKQALSDENDSLKDSTKMDWFIRGAAVSIIAFLLGIIVTRIKWRRQDSWGSY